MLALGRNTYSSSLDLCLTSRALGAAEVIFIGKKDPRIERYITSLNKKWGGKFKVYFAKSLSEVMKKSEKSIKIYLTRYGTPLQDRSATLRTYKHITLIVTHNESSANIHKLSDFNISITSQPHHGAAAIAIFLHEYYKGRELAMHFENAELKLVPGVNGIKMEKPS